VLAGISLLDARSETRVRSERARLQDSARETPLSRHREQMTLHLEAPSSRSGIPQNKRSPVKVQMNPFLSTAIPEIKPNCAWSAVAASPE
jgi:hypothetical protein